MTTTAISPLGRPSAGLLLLGSLFLAGPLAPAGAQPPPVPLPGVDNIKPDLQRNPLLPPLIDTGAGDDTTSAERGNRIRLFRIQPGFLIDPLGVMDDDPATTDPTVKDPDADWINVTLGYDNPYFDFRQRGDPGGLGFYRVNTQVQLFDTSRTACSLGVQAYAPAGIQFNGLPDNLGSTVLAPALSLYHALDDDTSFQGYVGKNQVLQSATTNPVEQNLHYGVALQRSLSNLGTDNLRSLYLSVGALGAMRLDPNANRPPVAWEVLPGLHWKVSDGCWLSGGVMVPVGATRTEYGNGNWQFTCQFQF